ncbi:APC6, partial [Symbiodinium microadriaticum]
MDLGDFAVPFVPHLREFTVLFAREVRTRAEKHAPPFVVLDCYRAGNMRQAWGWFFAVSFELELYAQHLERATLSFRRVVPEETQLTSTETELMETLCRDWSTQFDAASECIVLHSVALLASTFCMLEYNPMAGQNHWPTRVTARVCMDFCPMETATDGIQPGACCSHAPAMVVLGALASFCKGIPVGMFAEQEVLGPNEGLMRSLMGSTMRRAWAAEEFARSLMPTDPHVYNELGVVAYHKHSYEEACELLQRAISLSSDPEETLHVNLGHALLQCGLHARALEAFRAGLRLQPQSRGALSGVAFALQLQ